MSTLVLGASGTVGRRIAAGLERCGVTVRRASRGRDGDVPFDWNDPATHAVALHGVDAVHVMAPPGDAAPEHVVLPFLERAAAAGVRRATLLSASSIPDAATGPGLVAARLRDHLPEGTVLRPTWFASNVTDDHAHADSVRRADEVVTATADGRIPFIDPDDIAAVAVSVLTSPTPPEAALVLTGPEPLSFDEVATELSRFTGRTIVHRRVDQAGLARRWAATGMPAEFAGVLAAMDTAIAAGAEDRTTTDVERTTGRPPRTFREFLTTRDPRALDRPAGVSPRPAS